MLNGFVKILFALVVMASLSFFEACTDDVEQNRQYNVEYEKQKKESLEKANRYMVLKENEDIDNYIERHNLNVERIGTGLCYSIVKQGDTKPIEKGDLVTMEYEVRMLTGDLLYSSKENGPMSFIVGIGGMESGLEEAIVHLHKGDVAVIIIPSYYAHGLLGDGNRIPPKTPIVYNVKIIENQSNK